MIRKINYGKEGYSNALSVKYIGPAFINEFIYGSSIFDTRDNRKMNDEKPILEFMRSLNRETRRGVLRRNSV